MAADADETDFEQMEAVAAQVKPITAGTRIVVCDSHSPYAGMKGLVVAAGAGKRRSITVKLDGAAETRLMRLSAVIAEDDHGFDRLAVGEPSMTEKPVHSAQSAAVAPAGAPTTQEWRGADQATVRAEAEADSEPALHDPIAEPTLQNCSTGMQLDTEGSENGRADEPELLDGSCSGDEHDRTGDQMHVHVRVAHGDTTYTIAVPSGATVKEVKEELQKTEGTPTLQQQLTSQNGPGRTLADSASLREYGLGDGCVLLLATAQSSHEDGECGVLSVPSFGDTNAQLSSPSSQLSKHNLRKHDVALEKQTFFAPPAKAIETWLSDAAPQEAALQPAASADRSSEPQSPVDRSPREPSDNAVDEPLGELEYFLQCAGLLNTEVGGGETVLSALATLGVEAVDDIEVLEDEDYASVGVHAEHQAQLAKTLVRWPELERQRVKSGQRQASAPLAAVRSDRAAASSRIAQLAMPLPRWDLNRQRRSRETRARNAALQQLSPNRQRAVEAFVSRQEQWRTEAKFRMDEKRAAELGTSVSGRKINKEQLQEFFTRQQDAHFKRTDRREQKREEVIRAERGSNWFEQAVDVASFVARQQEKWLETQLKMDDIKALHDAKTRPSGVPQINRKSAMLAEEIFVPGFDGQHSDREIVASRPDVFQRLSSPERQYFRRKGARNPHAPSQSKSARSRPPTATSARNGDRPRAQSAQRTRSTPIRPVETRPQSAERQRNSEHHDGGEGGKKHTPPRIYRQRVQQYGQYANALNRRGRSAGGQEHIGGHRRDSLGRSTRTGSQSRKPAAMAMSSAADAVRLSKQLKKVQLELERMRKEEKAQRQNLRAEVLEQLAAKTAEAQDLRGELDSVRHRLTAALSRPLDSSQSVDHVSDARTSSDARISSKTVIEPMLVEFLSAIGCQHCQVALAELGVTSPADLTYVTDEELGAAGLRPVQWRKIRAAANNISGQSGAVPLIGLHQESMSPVSPKSKSSSTRQRKSLGRDDQSPVFDSRRPAQRRDRFIASGRSSSMQTSVVSDAAGENDLTEMKRALQVERLAREEAEHSLLAEREVMEEMKKMQVKSTAERQRQHASASVAGSTAQATGPHDTSEAPHGLRSDSRMQHGTDTWRKLGAEIQSLESNISFIENMLLPEDDSECAAGIDDSGKSVPVTTVVHEL